MDVRNSKPGRLTWAKNNRMMPQDFSVIWRPGDIDDEGAGKLHDLKIVPYSDEYSTILKEASKLLHKAGDSAETPRYSWVQNTWCSSSVMESMHMFGSVFFFFFSFPWMTLMGLCNYSLWTASIFEATAWLCCHHFLILYLPYSKQLWSWLHKDLVWLWQLEALAKGKSRCVSIERLLWFRHRLDGASTCGHFLYDYFGSEQSLFKQGCWMYM